MEHEVLPRKPLPTDRRAMLVSLTDEGGAAERLRAEHGKLAAELFADLSGAELATFVAVLDRTLGRLRGGSPA